MIVWIVGRSASGKTQLAKQIQKAFRSDYGMLHLDGDDFRQIFGPVDDAHTIAQRKKNFERIVRLCKFLDNNSLNVVCSILSIFPEEQLSNKTNFKNYFEIYLDASFDTAKSRDNKGLYEQAIRGELQDFVGVDIPYEAPLKPDLILKNDIDTDFSQIIQKAIVELKKRIEALPFSNEPKYLEPVYSSNWFSEQLDDLSQKSTVESKLSSIKLVSEKTSLYPLAEVLKQDLMGLVRSYELRKQLFTTYYKNQNQAFSPVNLAEASIEQYLFFAEMLRSNIQEKITLDCLIYYNTYLKLTEHIIQKQLVTLPNSLFLKLKQEFKLRDRLIREMENCI